jgi:hypothetical protein
MPIKNPATLNQAQDEVFANKAYWPTLDGETFCNLATHDVLSRLGYGDLKGLTADQMYAYVSTSKDWLIKPMADAQELANEGTILISILPAVKLGQEHGHINTITTGQGDFSGRWNCKTPFCMNLGKKGTPENPGCFRSKGINWAFQIPPEIYALVSTL